MKPTVFFSTLVYSLGKQLGMEGALKEVDRQLNEAAETKPPLAVVRTIVRLRTMVDVSLLVDAGSNAIGKTRSRAFHAAWESEAPIWVACDDDVETTQTTLMHLLDAVDVPEPQIVVVPYLLRGPKSIPVVAVEFPSLIMDREFIGARSDQRFKLRRCLSAGFGLVAMNRPAIVAIREHWEASDLWYTDHDRIRRLGLFLETITEGRWVGEDISFFSRVPKSVRVDALLTGASSHDGQSLTLETLDTLGVR